MGAAGSTGRGEANVYGLCSFVIVENMRRGMAPKDAGMDALRRIKAATIERRLLNGRGEPNFNVNFYVLNAKGEYAGVALYGAPTATYGVCTENGAESRPIEPLLSGSPTPEQQIFTAALTSIWRPGEQRRHVDEAQRVPERVVHVERPFAPRPRGNLAHRQPAVPGFHRQDRPDPFARSNTSSRSSTAKYTWSKFGRGSRASPSPLGL